MELKEIFCHKDEKPLDNIPSDGGYTAIFRTIACVGDSLSSGEFEAAKEAAAAPTTICTNIRGGSLWQECAAARSTICPAVE